MKLIVRISPYPFHAFRFGRLVKLFNNGYIAHNRVIVIPSRPFVSHAINET